VTETYVCATCRATVDRDYEVRSLIRTCDDCDRNGRFLHRRLVESLASIPDADRPDEWDELRLDQQFEDALKRGLIQLTRE